MIDKVHGPDVQAFVQSLGVEPFETCWVMIKPFEITISQVRRSDDTGTNVVTTIPIDWSTP